MAKKKKKQPEKGPDEPITLGMLCGHFPFIVQP